MSMSSIPSSSQSGKLYGWVERIGNKVPHPFLLFIYLIIVLMVTTAILSAFGVSAKNPTDGTPVVVKNLLSVEGLHWFLPNVIKNFSGFAPLGAILALVLGAGLAERVGLLPALMVKMASHVNARYASYMVLFIAFFSHISSDAALVIMPMEKLHALNMLSGDPHRGNFIVSKDGVRIIDLSGKSCTAERKARDRLAMERHLGIANEIKDYGYYSVIYRTKLRKFIKKLKGKA